MSTGEVAIRRPQRWETPFGESMSQPDVDRILKFAPFNAMQPENFPRNCSLRGLLLNDTRIVEAGPRDILVREGDYGNSAFLILQGSVRVMLQSLPARMLGRPEVQRKSLWATAVQNFLGKPIPEVRRYGTLEMDAALGPRRDGSADRVFLQDVPGVLDAFHHLRLLEGEIFGELAALTRSPRTATVVADEPAMLLEIRWQGLRDLMRFDPALKTRIDTLYRQNSLETHLRETPVLANVDATAIGKIAAATALETYGRFDWNVSFAHAAKQDPSQRIHEEPLIVAEGERAESLLMIRSGFARVSRHYGNGHQTLAYLGKGRMFGMDELIYEWATGESQPMLSSLRAVGYVDVLRLPKAVVQEYILPTLDSGAVTKTVKQVHHEAEFLGQSKPVAASEPRTELTLAALEFLLDQRFINGTQAMVINTDRCTRCDDCLRACAATHDHNPRFVRQGAQFGKYMIAHACMHCVDPVCMIGCPTGAIARDANSGNVLINDLTCIGCATCANSCPYQNIRMVETRDANGSFLLDSLTQQPIVKATKCDLCTESRGGPACQRACPHDALIRIDLSSVKSIGKWIRENE